MNKTNFLAKDDFPVSTNTFDKLQQATNMAAMLALLGGTNYILSGCVDNGLNITPGIMVVDGEILPFKGGVKKNKITILETKTTLEAFDILYPEAYIERTAVFSDEGQYNWSDFKQVLSNTLLEDRINAITGDVPGTTKMWAGRIDRIPEDYRLCNGDILTTVQFPRLAYFLGKETEQNFALPDLRQRFIVGYDNAVNSEYSRMWSTGGIEKVKLTIEQMPNHTHKLEFVDEKWGDNANSRPFPNPAGTSGYTADTTSSGSDQAHENRPPYFVLAYIIKVK